MIVMKVGSQSIDFVISDQTLNALRPVWRLLEGTARGDEIFHNLFCEVTWQANKEKLPQESQVRDQLGELMLPPVVEDDIHRHVAHLLEEPSFLL